MAFVKSADGIAKQGKTKGKNLGNDGPNVAIKNGPKHSIFHRNLNRAKNIFWIFERIDSTGIQLDRTNLYYF